MRLAFPLEKLVEELSKLPGIGPKGAQRIAFYIMKLPEKEALSLAVAIETARRTVKPCNTCGYLTDKDICDICTDDKRDNNLLCLVEESKDLMAIERTRYNGKYYVLNTSLQFMNGVDLTGVDIEPLLSIIKDSSISELIIATNPSIDGDVFARYIANVTRDLGVKVTRLAYGLPIGGDIEYVDQITLTRAFEGRKELAE
ncbi:MAG: recombination mediator RecR [Chitinophagales bacterium]